MTKEAIMRYEVADYLNTGKGNQEEWAFCGTGFNTLDENPAAQMDTKVYISDKAASSTVKSYQPQFAYDTDLMKSEEAIMDLYQIGRNELTGTAAERDYLRVELFEPVADKENTFKARKFRVAVEVASCAGAGGEAIKVTGNLHGIGNFVDGEFNTATKVFTETTKVAPAE